MSKGKRGFQRWGQRSKLGIYGGDVSDGCRLSLEVKGRDVNKS
jgi:hypothetical protein